LITCRPAGGFVADRQCVRAAFCKRSHLCLYARIRPWILSGKRNRSSLDPLLGTSWLPSDMYWGNYGGVTVSVLLCGHEKGSTAKRSGQLKTKPPATITKGRILVVNDEEPIRQIIVSMLTTAGYDCMTAADGLEALTVIESGEAFDLLLSNFMMPNLDGMGLLERIQGRFPNMLFVLESACKDFSVFGAALRNGAYDYLQEPFERDQLLFLVGRALEYRRLKLESLTYQTKLESLVKARTDQLEAAISNLERSYDITLETLGEALDLKDRETEGHSKRVTAFTIAIARAMGLPREQIAVFARGAFLHDIGKMSIPSSILLKRGKLDDDETAIIREHCGLGYQIVKKIPFLSEAAEIVFAHHERFDGTGYPRGLKGNEIPLGARIVALANTLDSITSDLPYRPARSLSAARDEIQRWAGRQFDPEIVRVFLEMSDNIWTGLREQIVAQTQRPAPPPPHRQRDE
jgi:putative nucleotidyltransferase with HDIG domain